MGAGVWSSCWILCWTLTDTESFFKIWSTQSSCSLSWRSKFLNQEIPGKAPTEYLNTEHQRYREGDLTAAFIEAFKQLMTWWPLMAKSWLYQIWDPRETIDPHLFLTCPLVTSSQTFFWWCRLTIWKWCSGCTLACSPPAQHCPATSFPNQDVGDINAKQAWL